MKQTLDEAQISRAKNDGWWWLYFLGMYETLEISFNIYESIN